MFGFALLKSNNAMLVSLFNGGAGIATKRRKGHSLLQVAKRRKRPGLAEVRAAVSRTARYHGHRPCVEVHPLLQVDKEKYLVL